MIVIRPYLKEYQSSFSPNHRLKPDQRTRMTEIFKQIISHYEPLQPEDGPYRHITLLKLTYDYVLSNESRDRFLKYFWESVKVLVEDEFHFEAWDHI
jgi:hypothetical protein